METWENRRDFFTGAPVEGELLAERLSRGSISPEQALRYGIALGNLVHLAHSAGIVHGAVSPWSVALAPDGLTLLQPPSDPDPAAAAYRSPEQVRGEVIDWRSDIFSFGSVLYALVAEKAPFAGVGPELDQAIQNKPAPALLAKSPVAAAMESVVAGCMAKDPAVRRQRAQNAVIELKLATRPRFAAAHTSVAVQHVAGSRRPAPPAKASRGFRWQFLFGILVVILLAATAVAAVLILVTPHSIHGSAPQAVLSFPVVPPANASYPGTPAISPDGRYLVLSALASDGKRTLWLRAMTDTEFHPIAGTEGAFAPFWSPDSRFIGFFADEWLRKIGLDDRGQPIGAPKTVCAAGAQAGGGAWNPEGTILFAADLSSGLQTVPAAGGKPKTVLALDAANGFHSYRWPQFLPDGQHFIFFGLAAAAEKTGEYVAALDSSRPRRLLASQSNAVFSRPAGDPSAKSGYLLYIEERDLMARPFNVSQSLTTGEAVRVVADIGSVSSLALSPVSVSDNAILVYQSIAQPTRQLVWVDRSGKQLGRIGEPANWGPPRISPDGNRVVVGKATVNPRDPRIPQTSLWIVEQDGSSHPLLADEGAVSLSPIWSPDGSRIAFACCEWKRAMDLYAVSAGKPGKKELLYRSAELKNPTDWSGKGKYLLFGSSAPDAEGRGVQANVWALGLPSHDASLIAGTIFDENYATLSPDGKWLAYQSTESGQNEVYVQAFDSAQGGTRQRWQISPADGLLPRWKSDGSELCFMTSAGALMAVAVHASGQVFAFNKPEQLFQVPPIPNNYNLYDASPDGQKFLLNLPMEWSSSAPISVLTAWTEKSLH
jgi:Tol biopolymer transport system component